MSERIIEAKTCLYKKRMHCNDIGKGTLTSVCNWEELLTYINSNPKKSHARTHCNECNNKA